MGCPKVENGIQPIPQETFRSRGDHTMSYIKPLLALIVAAFIGSTVVACDGGATDTATTDAA